MLEVALGLMDKQPVLMSTPSNTIAGYAGPTHASNTTTTAASPSSSGQNLGVVVGAAAGGFLLFAAVGFGWKIYAKNGKRLGEKKQSNEEIGVPIGDVVSVISEDLSGHDERKSVRVRRLTVFQAHIKPNESKYEKFYLLSCFTFNSNPYFLL